MKNSGKTISEDTSYRGFIARLLCAEQGKDPFATSDVGQCADRVLITSVYCPLASDTKFGCTHGFVELENTTNSDIPIYVYGTVKCAKLFHITTLNHSLDVRIDPNMLQITGDFLF